MKFKYYGELHLAKIYGFSFFKRTCIRTADLENRKREAPEKSKFPILVIFKVHKDLFFENFKNLLKSAKMRLIWTSSLKFG